MLLFFVPGAKALNAQVISDHGLSHLAGKASHRETFRGPNGAGLIIGDNTIPADLLAFSPDSQTWSERWGLQSMVGHWHDHPPTPDSLARKDQLPGQAIKLLDGHFWLVPLLRQWRDIDEQITVENKLPRVMQQSTTSGRFVLGPVVPQYRRIWETSLDLAQQILTQVSSGDSAALEDDQVNQFVIDLLAINYRIDASIVSHLQLLTPELCGSIVSTALDLDSLRRSLKNLYSRRTSGGTNSESGATPPTAG